MKNNNSEKEEIKELQKYAKDSFGLDLTKNKNTPPHKKPEKCENCGRKHKLYLFRSELENKWLWGCKRCEERINYEFFYRK